VTMTPGSSDWEIGAVRASYAADLEGDPVGRAATSFFNRLRDTTRLHLAGHYGASVARLGHQPRVRVEGLVEDLRPLRSSCHQSVAPLRYGAGLQTKAIETLPARSRSGPVSAASGRASASPKCPALEDAWGSPHSPVESGRDHGA
jgi:hypothetical protein